MQLIGSMMLEACVLAILARQDSYGYELTNGIKALREISESTLYPILRRLRREGLLETYDMACQGRNRRYYRLTEAGRSRNELYLSKWRYYRTLLDQILEGQPAVVIGRQDTEK